jgi:serine carboxypeptidase 1
MLIIHQFF